MTWQAATGGWLLVAACMCLGQTGGALDVPPASAMQERVMVDAEKLLGSWTKTDRPPCAAQYPAELTFQANGLYRGSPEPPAQFTLWDVGTWKLTAPGRLAISTANDAVVPYDVTMSGDTLVFSDAEGCRFAYRRAG
jgi:hypothetical protein